MPWGDIEADGIEFMETLKERVCTGEGPTIVVPDGAPPGYRDLMKTCFTVDPSQRPTFTTLSRDIEAIREQFDKQKNPYEDDTAMPLVTTSGPQLSIQ